MAASCLNHSLQGVKWCGWRWSCLARIANVSDCCAQLIDSRNCATKVWAIDAEEHILLASVHHSITDGVSAELLLAELSAAYAAAKGRQIPAWPPLPVQVR